MANQARLARPAIIAVGCVLLGAAAWLGLQRRAPPDDAVTVAAIAPAVGVETTARPGDEAEAARHAMVQFARFILARPSRIAPRESDTVISDEVPQEQLDALLAALQAARQTAEQRGLDDVRLALAAYEAVAGFAPLTRFRVFDLDAIVINGGRILPALNLVIDAIEHAYPDYRHAAAFRALYLGNRALPEPGTPLAAEVALAMSLAVANGPFIVLELMERCAQPGEAPLPRPMMTAMLLAAADLHGFYLRTFADPAEPTDDAARAAFIRSVRTSAQRCVR